MTPDERDHFAERFLDKALARYSDAEPREGLEGRILANMAAHRLERAPFWRRFAWVPVVCLALLTLVVGVRMMTAVRHHPAKSPVLAGTTPSALPSLPATTQATSPNTQEVATARREKPIRRNTKRFKRSTGTAVATVDGPRQPQFPSNASAPISEQERLLLAYMAATPKEELLKVSADQQQWREDVERRARATQDMEPSPQPQINHLKFSPLESGSKEEGASGAR